METRHRVYAENITNEIYWMGGTPVFPGEAELVLTTDCPDRAEEECCYIESHFSPDLRAAVY